MEFEKQFEDFLVRVIARAIQSANAVAEMEDKPKRTRKPKEAETVEVVKPAETPREMAVEIAKEPQSVQSTPVVLIAERKHAAFALRTVASDQTLGPAKAMELLKQHNVNQLADLTEDKYVSIVTGCAELLGKTAAQVITLADKESA